MMTPEELEVIDLLGQAFNKFVELPILHFMDQREFCTAIHAAQNIVLSRAGLRDTGIVRMEPDNRIIDKSMSSGNGAQS